MQKKYNSILLIRFSSLGDVLLTTPVIEVLKMCYPESRITFLTKEKYAPIFKNNKNLDEIILLKEEGDGLFKIISKLRKRHYDMVVDLHKSIRSYLISTFLNYSEYYGVDKKSLERRILVWLKKNYIPEGYHVVKAYLNSLKTVLNIDGVIKPKVYLGDDEIMWAHEYIKNKVNNTQIIAFAPGARWRTKQWSIEGFSALGNLIHKCSKYTVVLLGDKNDCVTAEQISTSMTRKPVNLAGVLSLREASAILKLSRLLVTNDSGLMHLAVAVGTPVISIFGPTVPEFGFAPLGDNDKIVQVKIPCRPCSLHGDNNCPEGHHLCMKKITVDMVWENVLEYIK